MNKFNIIPKDGYWLKEIDIRRIEDLKDAQYMGYWSIKNKNGHWAEDPVDVFYVDDPNVKLGHSHYFGIFIDHYGKNTVITNAISAFSQPITGIMCNDGTVIVSRYRHDYVTHDRNMIDGGRDYLKYSIDDKSKFVKITVDGNEFNMENI